MDPVRFFEIPTGDIEAARKWYAAVWGWRIVDIPTLATITETGPSGRKETRRLVQAVTGEVDSQGRPAQGEIPGLLTERSEALSVPTIFITVADLRQSLERVRKSGGSVIVEPTTAGDAGTYAYVQDPWGVVLGLWQDVIPGVRVGAQPSS